MWGPRKVRKGRSMKESGVKMYVCVYTKENSKTSENEQSRAEQTETATAERPNPEWKTG